MDFSSASCMLLSFICLAYARDPIRLRGSAQTLESWHNGTRTYSMKASSIVELSSNARIGGVHHRRNIAPFYHRRGVLLGVGSINRQLLFRCCFLNAFNNYLIACRQGIQFKPWRGNSCKVQSAVDYVKLALSCGRKAVLRYDVRSFVIRVLLLLFRRRFFV